MLNCQTSPSASPAVINPGMLSLAASEVLSGLGILISEEAMRTGVSNASWPGRMELIPGKPGLMLDGAHNPAGAAALAESLENCSYNRLLLVTGIMADKDAGEIIAPLAKMVSKAYCVSPAIERALDDKALAEITATLGISSTACGSVANGITTAKKEAGPNDLILVCGSLFTVGEAKAWLAGKAFEGIRG
jgi:dihydrofolate synthase/folylpolyglutamate synthase